MSKPPAFQFYPSDFLGDPPVQEMDLAETGAYIRLLCRAWLEEGIPADHKKLARFLKVSPRRFEALWETLSCCWQSDGNGKYLNPRMELVRAEQARHRNRRAAAGKAGAKVRWKA